MIMNGDNMGNSTYQTLPLPFLSLLTLASENDLTCAKGFLDAFHGLNTYADKAYRNASWQKSLLQDNQTQIFTPVKLAIGQKALDSADKLYSLALSRTRQMLAFLCYAIVKEHGGQSTLHSCSIGTCEGRTI